MKKTTSKGWKLERLAAMHNDNAEKGDSGGPWFWGNSAIGIHQGAKTIWSKSRDVFSQARYLDDALGVTVRK
ncbi:MAG: S1 family peptidase [Actinobacteria bacterium]|nr:S1 family peptidase [Actinomycetota bacterium]